jgi:arabinofuranan 3-O-arabinosyltransferase
VVRTSWAPTRQSYQVGGGGIAVLRVPQNYNPGWVAEMRGKTLQPVAVDGWQQGFESPAGERGSVVLRFTPDPWYRVGLLLGLLSAVGLVLALATVAVLERRSRRRLPAGPWTSVTADRRRRRTDAATSTSRPRHFLVGAGLALLALLAGGPAVAVGVAASALTLAVTRHARARAVILVTGAGLVVAAGALAAWRPVAPGIGPDAADALAGAAVGAMFATAALRPVRLRRKA